MQMKIELELAMREYAAFAKFLGEVNKLEQLALARASQEKEPQEAAPTAKPERKQESLQIPARYLQDASKTPATKKKQSRKNKQYTADEKNFVKENYGKKKVTSIARQIGRTKQAVYHLAWKLGVRRGKRLL